MNGDLGSNGDDMGEDGRRVVSGGLPLGADAHHHGLHERMDALEITLAGDLRRAVGATFVPAWKRLTVGEPRWPVTLAVAAALTMQAMLPEDLVLGPRWLLAGLGGALLVVLYLANPRRIDRASRLLRWLSLAVIGTITVANGYSATRLVLRLVNGGESDATRLLLTGGAIWLTNVIAFALWYWEFDRGGPVARMLALRPFPDFQFPQMENPELAPKDWEPQLVDYFYLSFTNATAFSPTDVMPLSRWAKLTMLAQSIISLLTVALIIARAVNILK